MYIAVYSSVNALDWSLQCHFFGGPSLFLTVVESGHFQTSIMIDLQNIDLYHIFSFCDILERQHLVLVNMLRLKSKEHSMSFGPYEE